MPYDIKCPMNLNVEPTNGCNNKSGKHKTKMKRKVEVRKPSRSLLCVVLCIPSHSPLQMRVALHSSGLKDAWLKETPPVAFLRFD